MVTLLIQHSRLSPSFLNSELLSESLPTYLWAFPHAASIVSLLSITKPKNWLENLVCEGTEGHSPNSVAARERDKAGKGHALAIAVPSYWETIGQFKILLGISAA